MTSSLLTEIAGPKIKELEAERDHWDIEYQNELKRADKADAKIKELEAEVNRLITANEAWHSRVLTLKAENEAMEICLEACTDEIPDATYGELADCIKELKADNDRLQSELDASCNVEELRQLREENTALHKAFEKPVAWRRWQNYSRAIAGYWGYAECTFEGAEPLYRKPPELP